MFRTLIMLGVLLCCGTARAAPREVEVTATGSDSREAITQGLVLAMEQVSGVVIVSSQAARSELASQVLDDQLTSTLTQLQQSETRKLTGGVVKSYRVLSDDAARPATVRLAVTIEVFEPKGLGNETRRRIAVATFGTPGSRPGATAERLRDRITADLVQARRFAVVDRSQDAAYAREMQLLTSGDAPLTERARLGQVIGADYIVTGTLRQTAATRADRIIPLTGEVVTSTTAGSAEADFQVIEIATRQVKWAGSVRVPGGDAIEAVAQKIATDITQTIYPLRLIRFDDPANVIVNQGGESMHAGQRFRAMILGEVMIDPYTNEPLGQAEQEAGVIEIRRVDPKMSYAALVSGRLPQGEGRKIEIVLRPAAAPVVAVSARSVRAPAAREAPAVTRLPFDP